MKVRLIPMIDEKGFNDIYGLDMLMMITYYFKLIHQLLHQQFFLVV